MGAFDRQIRRQFYRSLMGLCAAGYLWLWLSRQQGEGGLQVGGLTIKLGCPSKLLFGIPCAGCGNTRSVQAFFRGDFYDALMYNPTGILIALVMTICPLWILIDYMRDSSSLLHTYRGMENRLRHPAAIVLVLLLTLCNWIWNLQKFG